MGIESSSSFNANVQRLKYTARGTVYDVFVVELPDNTALVTALRIARSAIMAKGDSNMHWQYVAEKLDVSEGDARSLVEVLAEALGGKVAENS